jgi:hypothetical protein
VTAVLVGMRERGYVTDSLTPLAWEPHPDPKPLLTALAR